MEYTPLYMQLFHHNHLYPDMAWYKRSTAQQEGSGRTCTV